MLLSWKLGCFDCVAKSVSLASERVTSLLVQRSNQETPEKNTISLQPKSVRKIVEGLMLEGMR